MRGTRIGLDLPMVVRFIIAFKIIAHKCKRIPSMTAHCHATQELSSAKREGYYSIGQAAKLTGVTAKMIRHYESLRLVPKATRTVSDYRVYSGNDLHALKFIRRARGLGFSTQEIASLLGLWRNQRRTSAEVKRLALKHVEELDRKIAELNGIRSTLANLAKRCHGDHRPECPILDDLAALED
jgi:Cu(I)-responsive transcriptional regulator